jgi:hypothetical protein
MICYFNQVVVRVGLNRATSSAMLGAVASQPTIATVEPQQPEDAQSKTLEQRRMEAREILMKEKKRQLTSPGVFTERNIIFSCSFSSDLTFNLTHHRCSQPFFQHRARHD